MRSVANRYELHTLLGHGGTAQVWRARDLSSSAHVAVKILDRPGLADPDTVERFHREVRATTRVSHPNLVAGHDCGTTEDGRPYLVMELVEGTSLDSGLINGPLAVSETVRIAAEVCAALDAAHRAGVVHLDVKPGNVILGVDRSVKLLDFGTALLLDAPTTPAGSLVGTPHYLAPERISGHPVDGRADLYAVGCLLYEMLTGRPPFPGDDPGVVLRHHTATTPDPVRRHRPDVPRRLSQLVAELLAKDPADRPGSAGEVRARLLTMSGATQVMRVDPATAPPAGATRSLPRLEPSGPVGRATVTAPVEPVADPGFPEPLAATPAPARPGWVLPATAAVIGGLATLLLVLWLLPEDVPRPPAATPSPSVSGPAEAAQQVAETSPPPKRKRHALSPAEALARVRTVVNRQAAAGNINPDAKQKIDEQLAKIAKAIREGESGKARQHVAELRKKLEELARDHKIKPRAYDVVVASVNRLSRSLR